MPRLPGRQALLASIVTLGNRRLVHGLDPAVHVQLRVCAEIIGSHPRMFCLRTAGKKEKKGGYLQWLQSPDGGSSVHRMEQERATATADEQMMGWTCCWLGSLCVGCVAKNMQPRSMDYTNIIHLESKQASSLKLACPALSLIAQESWLPQPSKSGPPPLPH